MRGASQRLVGALASGERSAAHATRLGGKDVGPQIASWSVDRSYATDLPDAMRAFSGSSSAQFTTDLVGTGGQPAPALYGPWAPRASGDIARPGQSVTHRWGLSGDTLAAFRGTVRARSAESGSDVLRLSALDGAERLRMPARVPRPEGALRNTVWSTQWAASPVWVVDHLLRAAGIHTAPPPRPGCVLYVSLHGGIAPNIGYLESVGGTWGRWQKTGAPFESGALGGYGRVYEATYVPAGLPSFNYGGGTWYEMWGVNQPVVALDSTTEIHTKWSVAQGLDHHVTMRVNFTKGTLTASSGENEDPTKNPSVQWTWNPLKEVGKRVHVGWWVRARAGGEIAFTPVVTGEDGVPRILNDGYLDAVPMRFASALDSVRFGLGNMMAEAFQVSSLDSQPRTLAEVTQQGTWRRTASLSQPRFPLRMLPAVRGSAWDVITEIARATLATAEFTTDGYFRWRDHTRWNTSPGSADVQVTSARELAGLTLTEEIDACRNYCTVRVSDWSKVGVSGVEILKDSTDPVAIAPGESLARTLVIQETKTDPRTPKCLQLAVDPVTPDTVAIRAGTAADSDVQPASVEVTMHRDPGTVTLSLRNRSGTVVYYHGAQLSTLTPSSDPAPYLWSAWNEDSQRAYGTQVYEHDVKGWVQDLDSAKELADALRNAGAFPVPLLQAVEILPDPRIELGDVVSVKDTTGAQFDTLAWVIGIKTAGASGRVTQTLTLRGTVPNGVPQDAGLVPDPPTDPDAPQPP